MGLSAPAIGADRYMRDHMDLNILGETTKFPEENSIMKVAI